MKIANVIFDIGNVLVKWAPYEVIKLIYPERDPEVFYKQIRPIWIDLNLGKLTEKEAIILYKKRFEISNMSYFMHELKIHQTPIPGSLELLKKLDAIGINLYSITDNVREIMEYHKVFSNFMVYFQDIVVSADVGMLKPDPKIYQYLLNKHLLNPKESVFIDDLLVNVEGAMAVEMQAFQFIDAKTCEEQLIKLGIEFK